MKRILSSLALCVIAQFIYAQPPAGPANIGDTYGEKIDSKGVESFANISKSFTSRDTVDTKLSGKVLAACPKKGCWMQVELEDKSQMFVKFKDYAFFVPMDIVGKTIVVDGIAFKKETSVAELKHYAKDAKKSQAEIDAITQPRKETRFLANGVLVVN